ncbi:MAG TPA: BON domain-containing protein [Alphaproteobacteria bacterium]|jgi:osmotically-inducible protein OsmY|nr:BON domain-containing protein [Alphaproteobacteria bacterium]
MMTFRNAALIAVSAALLSLGACTSPTGLIDAATIPAEDRSFQDSTVDAEIKFAINKKMIEEDSRLFVDVNTVVYEGRVLLTGKVETNDAHDRAERIAYQVPNVKEVINELVVTTDRSFVSGVNDVANEVKIKAQLVATSGVRSINYRWRSLAGTVYLIGTAQNAQELNTVIEVIRRVDGVRRVVNYARVRGAA